MNVRDPKVSVVVPCYNTGRYLGEAIESVLVQTFQDFEIIIIDDGSTDDTAGVAAAHSDPRIRYFYQENLGLAAARNTGLRHARGGYVSFLDADDLFSPDKLTAQVAYLDQHPEAGLVVGGHRRIGEKGDVLYTSPGSSGVIRPQDLLVSTHFPIHSTLIRKSWTEKVGGFDEGLPAAEDWDFHCRLALKGCVMHRQPGVVCDYRLVPNAMSASAPRQTAAVLKVAEKLFGSGLVPPKWRRLESQSKAWRHLTGALLHYTVGLLGEGNLHLAEALRLDPDLAKDNYARVIGGIPFWAHHMGLPSAESLVRKVFDSLPPNLDALRRCRKHALFLGIRRDVTRSLQDREWLRASGPLLRLLVGQPLSLLSAALRVLLRWMRRPKRERGAQC